MSIDPAIYRTPQIALPIAAFGATYVGAKATLLHFDDQGLLAVNPYRRVAMTALAGGVAGTVAHPFARIANYAANVKHSNPNQTHFQCTAQAIKTAIKPGVAMGLARNAGHGLYPGFLAMGALSGAKEAYHYYQRQVETPS